MNACCDIDYPAFKAPEDAVRANVHLMTFIVQQKDEKTSKLTYISDSDLKGDLPDFVKNMVVKDEGEVAAKVHRCLIDWRKRNGR